MPSTFRCACVADGSITKQAEQPCEWVPPDASLAGHRLCLLADQCYAFVPKGPPSTIGRSVPVPG